MIDVDATGARARQHTWMLGGALLTASAFIGLWLDSLPGLPLRSAADVLFASGLVVLAVGLRRAGSVTGRRPLGTGALIALAVWLLLSPLQQLLIPSDAAFDDPAAWTAYGQVTTMLSVTTEVVSLALALIAVVQIGRSEVVPEPWSWAPLWALGVVFVMRALPLGMMLSPTLLENPDAAAAVTSLTRFLVACAVGFLGVLAMVLAMRPAPGSTVVYSSGR